MKRINITQKKQAIQNLQPLHTNCTKIFGGRDFLVWKLFDNACFKRQESDKGSLCIGDGNFTATSADDELEPDKGSLFINKANKE
jgi:hypothetical protein